MKLVFYFSAVFFCCIQLLLAQESRVVLVTGGAGYIGSHTCKALSQSGFIPVTYDSLVKGSEDAVKWGPLVIGDLLDPSTLDQVFTEYKPCAVIHFAGFRNVGESIENPSLYYTNNIVGSIHLLNAMVRHGVKTIIFSSSCTVYGNSEEKQISEAAPKNPLNPYAMSKYVIERAITDYADAYNIQYMILRYFNAAGVEEGLHRCHHSYNFLIPKTLLAILYPQAPLQIFGTDYPTKDGTCIRDYIHVKDLALAHVQSLEHLLKGNSSNALNLGTGIGLSVLEIIQAIEEETGQKVPYECKPRREGDAIEAVANPHKAASILGFYPSYSDLHTIIQSEWDSIKKTNDPKNGE